MLAGPHFSEGVIDSVFVPRQHAGEAKGRNGFQPA